MIKQILVSPLLIVAILFTSCRSGKKEKPAHPKPSNPESYAKSDLLKIKWIEGKWRGMDGDNPFYEIYEFLNDSTIQITGFDWDGKDSSKTWRSTVYWHRDGYYMGDQLNWKVNLINNNQVIMLPNRHANNDILWQFRDSTSWHAILNSPHEIKEYNMEYYDPFTK